MNRLTMTVRTLVGLVMMAGLLTWQAPTQAGPPPDCKVTVSCEVAKDTLWPPNHNLVDVGLVVRVCDPCNEVCRVCVTVFSDEPEEDQTGDGRFSPDAKPDHENCFDKKDCKRCDKCRCDKRDCRCDKCSSFWNKCDCGCDKCDGWCDKCDHCCDKCTRCCAKRCDKKCDCCFEKSVPLRLRAERKGNGNGRVYLIVIEAFGCDGSPVARHCCTVVVPHDQSAQSIASVEAQAAAAEEACEILSEEDFRAFLDAFFVPVGDGPIIGPKQ